MLNNRFSILHVKRNSNFGKVLLALDTFQNPPRRCAIEVYEPSVKKPEIEQWVTEEFQKEASRLKQLSQIERQLPEIYTYFYDDRAYYIVRELIEGTILREQVRDRGKLSPAIVRKILIKLLSLLDFLHQQGVVHQKIEPENLILRHSDNVPLSLAFGKIEQIIATFNFHGDRQKFFLKDARGYIPSEQALGKPSFASDLYSLGLTAIYLLTAKDPVDLSLDLSTGNYQIPSEIKNSDLNLAGIIARATMLNPSDRYSSANEMLNALLMTNSKTFFRRIAQNHSTTNRSTESKTTEPNNKNNNFTWQTILLTVLGSLFLFGLGSIASYKWNSTRSTVASQQPASRSLSPTVSELPEASSDRSSFAKHPSLLNSNSQNLPEIPIFATGTSKQVLREALGEPNAIQPGYWSNSSAWIYKDWEGKVDLGYLFDRDTDKLRQTEIAIAPNVGLATIEEILNSLLQGNINPSVAEELEKIYEGQTDEYLFALKNLEGSIKRDKDGRIYIGIWEANFH